MSLKNPDILYPLLDDLAQQVSDLNHRISDAADDADRLKNISTDQLTKAAFDTDHAIAVAADDEEQINYWDREAITINDRALQLHSGIKSSEVKMNVALSACHRSSIYWNGQLDYAKARLQEWKNHFQKALREMMYAQQRYEAAQSAYNTAYNNHQRCINAKDSQGRPANRNCSGYVSQMNKASRDMDAAQRDFQYWEGEKIKAEAEIRRWESRISSCNDSLQTLANAVRQAEEGLLALRTAETFISRSIEEIRSAMQSVQKPGKRTKSSRNSQRRIE